MDKGLIMYTDLYLKFTDEAESRTVLYTQVPTEWNEEGEPTAWYSQPNYANIDVIGVIYEPQEDPEVEPIALEGWHVNVRVIDEDSSSLEPFVVVPTNPRRVWG
jgi:hypothetical protein